MNEYFPEVSEIKYEGPDSTNPLAFKHYNPSEEIEGKTMKDHLRFSVAYWHTFRNGNADPFGAPTRIMPWEHEKDNVKNAKKRAQAAFEFFEKLNVPFYCFHDRDIAPEGDSLKETNDNLEEVSDFFKEEQERTGVQLLWGTSCLFANPRFLHGAGTSCNADVYAYAAAQVAKALEVTKKLNGKGFVFWGGREGYKTLLNTDMKRELDHYARFLEMAVEYKEKIGFDGQFYIEPKPKEPTKHQYDSDAAACCAFLRKYDLLDHFKLNIEANHATLAGHTFMHELEYSAANDMLGSVDANRGDLMLGWDTDQFPTNLYDTTLGMLTILNNGGFTTGGLNFDAHVTRESFEPVDLFHAHIAGMDTFARGLKAAAAMRKDGILKEFTQNRYASWDSGIGADVEAGKVGFEELSQYMLEKGEPDNNESGRGEMLENILNSYI